MRILIIGGTRFIGPQVVTHLVRMGHQVTLFHRGTTQADLPAGVQRILGDRRALPEFLPAFRRAAPEIVLDMIPLGEGDVRQVLDTFRGLARWVVAISSQDVYRAYGRFHGSEPGPPEPVPLDESAPLRERLYPYRGQVERLHDYDKILVERAVLGDPDMPGTVLRPPMVYGPGDRQHRLFPYLKRMDDGRSVIFLGQGEAGWRWTRGYVEDVAWAIALAVTSDQAAGRVYNVGEPEALDTAAWVRAIGRAAGWAGEVRAVPQEQLPGHLQSAAHWAQDLVTDSRRIREELGYAEALPRLEALQRTIAWERAHPPEFDPSQFDYVAEDRLLD